MKRILLVILLITVFFTMPNSANAQERFIWIYSSNSITYSLDTKSIWYQDPIIDCWIRSDYTQEAIDSNVDFNKKEGNNLIAEKYSQCSFELIHWQYSTIRPYKHRIVGACMYDEKGNVLFSHQSPSNWSTIIPETVGETNFNKIYDYVLSNNIK